MSMDYDSSAEEGGNQDEEEEAVVAAKTGKKTFKDWSLSDRFESRAIDYLSAHEILWDKSHPDHSDKDIKARAWEEFSTALEGAYTAYHLEKWMTNLRSQVGRLKKEQLGVSGQAPHSWTTRRKFLWNNCQFLVEVIRGRSYEVGICNQHSYKL
jgi:hypothetical protein